MRTSSPAYIRDFRCLAGDCPLTCCRGWEVALDQDFLSQYPKAPHPLNQAIAGQLAADEVGQACFRLDGEGRCPMLGAGGLCAIQLDWGEEHLPVHCRRHPRFTEEYGCRTETSLAVSCPEAARLLMEQRGFAVDAGDDGRRDPPFEGVDPALLDGLVRTRDMALDILRESARPLWERLGRVYTLAAAAQRELDDGRWEGLQALSPPPAAAQGTLSQRRETAIGLLRLLSRFQPMDPGWPRLLTARANELEELKASAYRAMCRNFQWACPQWEAHLEGLACYFIFRHWPKALNDDALLGRAALAVAACLVLYHLSALAFAEKGPLSPQEECLLWASFSREVEHLDDTLSALVDELADGGAWPLPAALCPTEPAPTL